MMKTAGITIGRRLIFGFGVVLLIAIAIGATGYYSANSISEGAISAFRLMLSTDAAVLEHSTRARANVLGLRRAEKDMFLNIDSPEVVAKYLEAWNSEREHLLARLDAVEKAATLEKDKELVKEMRTRFAAYETGLKKVLDRIRDGGIKTPQGANEAISEYKDAIHNLEKSAVAFSSDSSRKIAETENLIRTDAERAKFMELCLITLAIVIGAVVCVLSILSITRPLKRIIQGISEGADQVNVAAGQVSVASQELAEGASEQAASIEETSSSLEEMASMTKQSAQNACQANELMHRTREVASRANDSMSALTGSMREISTASEETSKIIKTIDEIAFQTNLLALNAAVEAARAGEAGAGFAVVADEVRNLAMRAAEAAKNTATLIESTVVRVKAGSALVAKTDQDFRELESSFVRSGELVGEISAASQEQSQGIGQVNKALSEMDKVVQQNAANAEESASASVEMSAQAERLKSYVGDLLAMVGGLKRTNGEGNRTGGFKSLPPSDNNLLIEDFREYPSRVRKLN